MINFAVLTIAYAPRPATLIFNVTTDHLCHLTCYYTDNKPGRHKTSRTDRGLTLPWGAYYCFVAWKTVEQMEAGDTLSHTFEIPDWAFCQTKWFSMRGTVSAVLSPSTTPIFEYHHPGFILPEVLYNLDFEIWPDPDEYAHFWSPFTFGGGYGAWDREETIVQHGIYSAKFTVGGFNHGRGFRQIQDVTPWRGEHLTFQAWARGLVHPMNRLTVGVNGTGAWLRHDSILTPGVWTLLSITGIIPNDATQIRMDVLGWSPGFGPTYTYFDNITIFVI